MKVTDLIWIPALAGIVAACNSGPPIDNTGGGTGGTGGGSGVVDACITTENTAVYDNLTYTDEDGVTYTGDEAASAIGSDCIFGTTSSDPVLAGCGDQALAVLGCFPGCDDATIQALADCVAQCTQDATATASPPGLSDECVSCTGDTVACGAAFCTNLCVADTNAPECIQCRCENNCIPAFDLCSGLPSGGECEGG
jgi:hypothetical protein